MRSFDHSSCGHRGGVLFVSHTPTQGEPQKASSCLGSWGGRIAIRVHRHPNQQPCFASGALGMYPQETREATLFSGLLLRDYIYILAVRTMKGLYKDYHHYDVSKVPEQQPGFGFPKVQDGIPLQVESRVAEKFASKRDSTGKEAPWQRQRV